jgi:hypothetical protein
MSVLIAATGIFKGVPSRKPSAFSETSLNPVQATDIVFLTAGNIWPSAIPRPKTAEITNVLVNTYPGESCWAYLQLVLLLRDLIVRGMKHCVLLYSSGMLT